MIRLSDDFFGTV